MTTAIRPPANVGDRVPDIPGRTDEGTPVSLRDFEGRALALFFVGIQLDRRFKTLLSAIRRHIDAFMDAACSPIVISPLEDEILFALREQEAYPFLFLSDPKGAITEALCGSSQEYAPGALLVSDEGYITTRIPQMPPRDVVTTAVSTLSRLSSTPPDAAV